MLIPPIYEPNHYPLSDPMHLLIRTSDHKKKELENYSHSFKTTNSRMNLAWYSSKRIQDSALMIQKASFLEIKIPELEEFISSILESITLALGSREKLTSTLEFYTVNSLCVTVKSVLTDYMLLNKNMSKCTDFEEICPVQKNLSNRFKELLTATLKLEEKILEMSRT